jgi:hypothetical protein
MLEEYGDHVPGAGIGLKVLVQHNAHDGWEVGGEVLLQTHPTPRIEEAFDIA